MDLRNHPLMRFHDIPSWPPLWTHSTAFYRREVLRGEQGMLKNCAMNRAVENMCFLFIEHNGERYTGALVVNDAAFCRQVFAVLRENLNRPIKDIGDLNLSTTL
jgi:hypothetical protein